MEQNISDLCQKKICCFFYLNLDKATESGRYDVGEGEGGKEAGERNYFAWDTPRTPDVWFVCTGASGMFRWLRESSIILQRNNMNQMLHI